MRNSSWLKFTAGVFTFLFVLNDIGQAAPALDFAASLRSEIPRVSHIEIPPEMATLEDWYESPNVGDTRLMLHIQDAHAQPEAQARIRDLIHYLNKQYGFKTVFVEGAAEQLDVKWLHPFKNSEQNKKWIEEKTSSGEMSGVDLALLDGVAGLKALPIETIEGYRDGYQKLHAVYTAEPEVNEFINFFDSKLDSAASKILNEKTRRILSEWKKFESGHRDFLPFVEKLAALAKEDLKLDLDALYSQIEWPQLSRLLVLQRVEKELAEAVPTGQRSKVKGQSHNSKPVSWREQALDEKEIVLNLLKDEQASSGLIHGLERFDEKHLNLNRITVGDGRQFSSPRALVEQLVEETRKFEIDLRDYLAFLKYAGYLILRGELQPSLLFKEIERLFEKFLEKTNDPSAELRASQRLTTNAGEDVQREAQSVKLIEIYRDSFLLKKLLNLELSREEWRKALAKREELEPQKILGRLKNLGAAVHGPRATANEKKITNLEPRTTENQDVERTFENAFDFYDAALAREDIFFEKISSSLAQNDKAILITGGFHSEGMNAFFREKEISYGTLTPRITNLAPTSLYRSAMMQATNLSKVSSQPTPALAQPLETIAAMTALSVVAVRSESRLQTEAADFVQWVEDLKLVRDPNNAAEIETVLLRHRDLFKHRPDEFPEESVSFRGRNLQKIPSRLIHQLDLTWLNGRNSDAKPITRNDLFQLVFDRPLDENEAKGFAGYDNIQSLRDLFYFLITKEHGRSLQLFAEQYFALDSGQRELFLEQAFDIHQITQYLMGQMARNDDYEVSDEILTAYAKAWPIVIQFGEAELQSGGILKRLKTVPDLPVDIDLRSNQDSGQEVILEDWERALLLLENYVEIGDESIDTQIGVVSLGLRSLAGDQATEVRWSRASSLERAVAVRLEGTLPLSREEANRYLRWLEVADSDLNGLDQAKLFEPNRLVLIGKIASLREQIVARQLQSESREDERDRGMARSELRTVEIDGVTANWEIVENLLLGDPGKFDAAFEFEKDEEVYLKIKPANFKQQQDLTEAGFESENPNWVKSLVDDAQLLTYVVGAQPKIRAYLVQDKSRNTTGLNQIEFDAGGVVRPKGDKGISASRLNEAGQLITFIPQVFVLTKAGVLPGRFKTLSEKDEIERVAAERLAAEQENLRAVQRSTAALKEIQDRMSALAASMESESAWSFVPQSIPNIDREEIADSDDLKLIRARSQMISEDLNSLRIAWQQATDTQKKWDRLLRDWASAYDKINKESSKLAGLNFQSIAVNLQSRREALNKIETYLESLVRIMGSFQAKKAEFESKLQAEKERKRAEIERVRFESSQRRGAFWDRVNRWGPFGLIAFAAMALIWFLGIREKTVAPEVRLSQPEMMDYSLQGLPQGILDAMQRNRQNLKWTPQEVLLQLQTLISKHVTDELDLGPMTIAGFPKDFDQLEVVNPPKDAYSIVIPGVQFYQAEFIPKLNNKPIKQFQQMVVSVETVRGAKVFYAQDTIVQVGEWLLSLAGDSISSAESLRMGAYIAQEFAGTTFGLEQIDHWLAKNGASQAPSPLLRGQVDLPVTYFIAKELEGLLSSDSPFVEPFRELEKQLNGGQGNVSASGKILTALIISVYADSKLYLEKISVDEQKKIFDALSRELVPLVNQNGVGVEVAALERLRGSITFRMASQTQMLSAGLRNGSITSEQAVLLWNQLMGLEEENILAIVGYLNQKNIPQAAKLSGFVKSYFENARALSQDPDGVRYIREQVELRMRMGTELLHKSEQTKPAGRSEMREFGELVERVISHTHSDGANKDQRKNLVDFFRMMSRGYQQEFLAELQHQAQGQPARKKIKIVLSHENPDPDAIISVIGEAYAQWAALSDQEKDKTLVMPLLYGEVPANTLYLIQMLERLLKNDTVPDEQEYGGMLMLRGPPAISGKTAPGTILDLLLIISTNASQQDLFQPSGAIELTLIDFNPSIAPKDLDPLMPAIVRTLDHHIQNVEKAPNMTAEETFIFKNGSASTLAALRAAGLGTYLSRSDLFTQQNVSANSFAEEREKMESAMSAIPLPLRLLFLLAIMIDTDNFKNDSTVKPVDILVYESLQKSLSAGLVSFSELIPYRDLIKDFLSNYHLKKDFLQDDSARSVAEVDAHNRKALVDLILKGDKKKFLTADGQPFLFSSIDLSSVSDLPRIRTVLELALQDVFNQVIRNYGTGQDGSSAGAEQYAFVVVRFAFWGDQKVEIHTMRKNLTANQPGIDGQALANFMQAAMTTNGQPPLSGTSHKHGFVLLPATWMQRKQLSGLLENYKNPEKETRRSESRAGYISRRTAIFGGLMALSSYFVPSSLVAEQNAQKWRDGERLMHGLGAWGVVAGEYGDTDASHMIYRGQSLSEIKISFDTRRGHAPQAVSINANGAIRGHAVQPGRNDGLASTFYLLRYHDEKGVLHDSALIQKLLGVKTQEGKLVLDVELGDREKGASRWKTMNAQIVIYPPDRVDGTLRMDIHRSAPQGLKVSQEKLGLMEGLMTEFIATNHSGADSDFDGREYSDAQAAQFYDDKGKLVLDRDLKKARDEVPSDSGFRLITAEGDDWMPKKIGGIAAFAVVSEKHSPAHQFKRMPIPPTMLVVPHQGFYLASGAVTYRKGETNFNSDNVNVTVQPEDVEAALSKPSSVSVFFMPGATPESEKRIPAMIQSVRRSEVRGDQDRQLGGAISFPIIIGLLGSFTAGVYVSMLTPAIAGLAAAALFFLPIYAGARFFWRTVVEGKNFPFQNLQDAFLWESKLLARVLSKNWSEIKLWIFMRKTLSAEEMRNQFDELSSWGLIQSDVDASFSDSKDSLKIRFKLLSLDSEESAATSSHSLSISRIFADGERVYFEYYDDSQSPARYRYRIFDQSNLKSAAEDLSANDYRAQYRSIAALHRSVPTSFLDVMNDHNESPRRWSLLFYPLVIAFAVFAGYQYVGADVMDWISLWHDVRSSYVKLLSPLSVEAVMGIGVLSLAGIVLALFIVDRVFLFLQTLIFMIASLPATLVYALIYYSRVPDLIYFAFSKSGKLKPTLLNKLVNLSVGLDEMEPEEPEFGEEEKSALIREQITQTLSSYEIGVDDQITYFGNDRRLANELAAFQPDTYVVISPESENLSQIEIDLTAPFDGEGIWERATDKTIVFFDDHAQETFTFVNELDFSRDQVVIIDPDVEVTWDELNAFLTQTTGTGLIVGHRSSFPENWENLLGDDERFEVLEADDIVTIHMNDINRSETRLQKASLQIVDALQGYANWLSTSEYDLSASAVRKQPQRLREIGAFMVLGNPDAKTFIEFAKGWYEIAQKVQRQIPIVIAGGIGRGTIGLIDTTLEHYRQLGRLNPAEEKLLLKMRSQVESYLEAKASAAIARSKQPEHPGVTEKNVIMFIFAKEGVGRFASQPGKVEAFDPRQNYTGAPVYFENGNSTNTPENFEFSKPVFESLVQEGLILPNQKTVIVTEPALLARIKPTLLYVAKEKGWQGDMNWPRARVYPLDLKKLFKPNSMTAENAQRLLDKILYWAGPSKRMIEMFPDSAKNVSELKKYADQYWGAISDGGLDFKVPVEKLRERVPEYSAAEGLIQSTLMATDEFLDALSEASYKIEFDTLNRTFTVTARSESRMLGKDSLITTAKMTFENALAMVKRRGSDAITDETVRLAENYHRTPEAWIIANEEERRYAERLSSMTLAEMKEHAEDKTNPIYGELNKYRGFDSIVNYLSNVQARRGGQSLSIAQRWIDILTQSNPEVMAQFFEGDPDNKALQNLRFYRAFLREMIYRWDTNEKPRSAELFNARSEMRLADEDRAALEQSLSELMKYLSQGRVYRMTPGMKAFEMDESSRPMAWDEIANLPEDYLPDAVLYFGSRDDQVPQLSIPVLQKMIARKPDLKIVTTGKWSDTHTELAGNFKDESGARISEAEHFARILERELAIQVERESNSTNTGQNISMGREKLTQAGVDTKNIKLLVVAQPAHQRRVGASVLKQWLKPEELAGGDYQLHVISATPRELEKKDIEMLTDDELLALTEIALGEIKRIYNYPASGFTVPVDVPAEVNGAETNLNLLVAKVGRLSQRAELPKPTLDFESLKTEVNQGTYNALSDIRDAIQTTNLPLEMILFGSYADGYQISGSDLDLMFNASIRGYESQAESVSRRIIDHLMQLGYRFDLKHHAAGGVLPSVMHTTPADFVEARGPGKFFRKEENKTAWIVSASSVRRINLLNGDVQIYQFARSEMRDVPNWKALGAAEQVKTLLYPGSGVDFSAGLSLALQLPNLTDIYYVDPAYSSQQLPERKAEKGYHYYLYDILANVDSRYFFSAREPFSMEEIIAFQKQFAQTGKVAIPIILPDSGGRTINIHLVASLFETGFQSKIGIPEQVDFILVKNPGTNRRLSQEPSYWNQVVESVQPNGIVAVTFAEIPGQGVDFKPVRDALGEPLFKSSEFSGQGLVWAGQWVVYQKKDTRTEIRRSELTLGTRIQVPTPELSPAFEKVYEALMLKLNELTTVEETAAVIAYGFTNSSLGREKQVAMLTALVGLIGVSRFEIIQKVMREKHADAWGRLQSMVRSPSKNRVIYRTIDAAQLSDAKLREALLNGMKAVWLVNPNQKFHLLADADVSQDVLNRLDSDVKSWKSQLEIKADNFGIQARADFALKANADSFVFSTTREELLNDRMALPVHESFSQNEPDYLEAAILALANLAQQGSLVDRLLPGFEQEGVGRYKLTNNSLVLYLETILADIEALLATAQSA